LFRWAEKRLKNRKDMKSTGWMMKVVAGAWLCAAGGWISAAPAVDNIEEGAVVRHPVVLLRGTVEQGADKLEVRTSRNGGRPESGTGLIHEGRFKALVELAPGENLFELKTEKTRLPSRFKLTYKPMSQAHFVRIVWLVDKDGETAFATPDDAVPQTYEERLRTAALLMQSFTAERMHELGYGRRTFRLEMDREGKPVVHTVRAPEPAGYYQTLNDDVRMWGEIGRFLNDKMPDPSVKNMVLMAFTRKDAEGRMLAHTALGGGNLGLFGSASVFSWPESIDAAQAAFLDDRKVDPSRVHEDSAGRGTHWAVASTTLGATLHEMGHTFGLPHCEDPRCIMTRGFDRFNRFFTFEDPWPGRAADRFGPDEEAWFSPVSASYLRWSQWFQPDAASSRRSDPRPELKWDARKSELSVEARGGLRWLGFYEGGDIRGYKEFADSAVRRVVLTAEELKELHRGTLPAKVVALDENGETSELRLE
jgi:hypothetical protein